MFVYVAFGFTVSCFLRENMCGLLFCFSYIRKCRCVRFSFLFSFLVDMLSLIITKTPHHFHFISCFQTLVNEIEKTIFSCFHHFLYKSLKTGNKVWIGGTFVIISENISSIYWKWNRKQTKLCQSLHFKKCWKQ